MTKTQIIDFINRNPRCFMATLEDGEPRVRGMGMYKADDTGLIFQTWKMKDIHRQLAANPQVELCFNSPDIQVRISGTMELVEDVKLKKAVEKQRPFMTAIIKKNGGYDCVAIYRLSGGRAHVWTMAANFTPKEYVQL